MAEPIFAAGMMADLMVSGAYAFACCMACPHSWAGHAYRCDGSGTIHAVRQIERMLLRIVIVCEVS